jgi:hypothetical protein
MKPIIHTALGGFAAVLVLTGTAAAKPTTEDSRVERMVPKQLSSHGVPIALATQPGSEADRLARQLMAREIERARAYGDHPLVLVGTARLGKAHEAGVLFVQVQSVSECGSAGCSTVSFRRTGGGWIRIMDTVSGTVRIAASYHRGMPDLMVQNGNRLVWDGAKYGDVG